MSFAFDLKSLNTEATEGHREATKKSALFCPTSILVILQQTLSALCGLSLASSVLNSEKHNREVAENRRELELSPGEPSLTNKRESFGTDLLVISVQEAHASGVRNNLAKVVCAMALPNERAKYSAIVDRPKAPLPNGERIIVWTIVNIEVWTFRVRCSASAGAAHGVTQLPDVPNWSWHEYGMRVGFLAFPCALRTAWDPAKPFDQRPVCALIIRAWRKPARTQGGSSWATVRTGPLQRKGPACDDRAHGGDDQGFYGQASLRMDGPGLTETYDTPTISRHPGSSTFGDWVYDDEPYGNFHQTRAAFQPCPIRLECNDIAMMAVQHHEAKYWTQKCSDSFEPTV